MDTDSAVRGSQDTREELRKKGKQKSRQWAHGYNNESLESEFEPDYHFEFIPSKIQRVTHYNNSSQCPAKDIEFMAATFIFEVCAEIHNECDECCILAKCVKLQSALADKGRDREVEHKEAVNYVVKFVKMITGVK
jgi:hypothetical protein